MNPVVTPDSNPIILAFVRHYLPGYKHGGPVRTIANMVESIGDEFDFRVVTSDRDAGDDAPFPDLPARGAWARVGKAQVLYLAPAWKGLRLIAKILRETQHDVLYLNSVFDPDFTLKPLLARRLGLAPKTRCIIAPRGEFSEGALGIKANRKKLFLEAARVIGLYRDLEWHASSAHEESDIQRKMGAAARRIRIANNLPDMTPGQPSSLSSRKPGEPLNVCFLSRITPVKNLDYALDVLAKVSTPVVFTIYGPCADAAYWNRCEAAIAALPPHVSVIHAGPLDPALIVETLSAYDLFFLPTKGENFGHAIAEALKAGLPLLISNRTPWRNLEAEGVGHDLPLEEPTAFVRAIEAAAATYDRAVSQKRSIDYLARQLKIDHTIFVNRALFSKSAYDSASTSAK